MELSGINEIVLGKSLQVYACDSESVALQDYLTTIYRLEDVYGVARTGMIATELGVTPATVTKMVAKLHKLGLVYYDKYRGVRLTEQGKRAAESIIKKHRMCECFLKFVLKFSLAESHIYAHIMEHLPNTIVERLFELAGRPSRCPHGNPIPGVSTSRRIDNEYALCDVTAPCKVKVVRIAGEFRAVLEFLDDVGIEVGSVLEVESVNSKVVNVRKAECGCPVSIPRLYAYHVKVMKL